MLCGKGLTEKLQEFLGGVVYEDPWLAGGHNGLSNSEDPLKPQPPYQRVRDLRSLMNEFKLQENTDYYGWRSLEFIRMGGLDR